MTFHWNWGVGIALTYTTFALGTAGVVAFAMAQPRELVSQDYYEESLHYDRRIEGTRNADALGRELSCVIDPGGRVVLLRLPPSHMAAEGRVILYRPSSARADRVAALSLDSDGVQRVSLEGLAPGAWRFKVEWTSAGRPYYFEKNVTVR